MNYRGVRWMVGLFIVMIGLSLWNKTRIVETFQALSPADVCSKISCFLSSTDVYPAMTTNRVSDKNASDVWTEYPVSEMSSFAQETNNKRYWENPDNGTASRSEFSNAFYKNRDNTPSNAVPNIPPPRCGENARRVNVYCADDGAGAGF